MAFEITDTEFVLLRQRADALDTLEVANANVRSANAEIVRLRRALTAANAEIRELRQENQTLGARLIALLRPKH